MATDPAMMAEVLQSGGGAGPAPGEPAMPPVGGSPGAPMEPPQTPEDAIAILEQFGITEAEAPIVAQALMIVEQAMGAGAQGGAPPGPPTGPGGPPPVV